MVVQVLGKIGCLITFETAIMKSIRKSWRSKKEGEREREREEECEGDGMRS
jgi:hypothetical protein